MISSFAGTRAFAPSLRARLLIAGVLVQTVMLALLIVNGISIMEQKFTERTRAQLDDQKKFLRAVLAPPLAARDYASAQRVLDRVRRAHSRNATDRSKIAPAHASPWATPGSCKSGPIAGASA